MNSNRERIITFMLVELEKGTDSNQVLILVNQQWQTPERTFFRLWKIARERYDLAQQEAQRRMADLSAQKAVERLEEAVIDKNTRMLIASSIASNESNFPADRLKALDYLAKMDGDYAPLKKELTGKDGTPLHVTRVINFKTRITTNRSSNDRSGT